MKLARQRIRVARHRSRARTPEREFAGVPQEAEPHLRRRAVAMVADAGVGKQEGRGSPVDCSSGRHQFVMADNQRPVLSGSLRTSSLSWSEGIGLLNGLRSAKISTCKSFENSSSQHHFTTAGP